MAQKVIITCAVTGSADTAKKNPAVPVTPRQIADSAIEAAKAGAAICHLHVRDPETGLASMELDYYREVVERIRDSGSDFIVNLTTGAGARFKPSDNDPQRGGPGTTLASPAERVQHVVALKPDICSLDVATMNSGGVRSDTVFMNTPTHLRAMAEAIKAAGVKPELEAFEPGHVLLGCVMIDNGYVDAPAFFQICLGVEWGTPATLGGLKYMTELVPANAVWAAFGVGRAQFPVVALAMLSGGHVRVGLEDNLYLERGVLAPSNAALVDKAATLIRLLGAEVATPGEARAMLSLPPR